MRTPLRRIPASAILSAFGGALFGLVVSLILLISFAPSGVFLSNQVSARLGREFKIEGPLSIDWDWRSPMITAERVTLANAPNLAEPHMVEIEKLAFRIDIWPLLIGKLSLPELHLESPRIILEKTDETTKNWQFPALSSGNMAVGAVVPDNRHQFPVIENLLIRDGLFVYRNLPAKLDLQLKLDTVEGKGGAEGDLITVNGTGSLQDQVFTLDAKGGSIKALRENSKPFPLKLDLAMGATHVFIDGTFSDPVRMKGIDAILKLKGDNMADLFYLTAIPLPPTPTYTLEGRLTKGTGIWGYQDFKGLVGKSDLSGNLTYDTSGERGFFKADLVSKNMSIEDLGGFIGQKPGKPAAKSNDRVLPDVPIALNRLRATDMDVTLDIAKLNAPALPFKGMNVRFDLKEGLLKLDPLKLTLADGSIDGRLQLDGRKDIPDVDMDLSLQKLKLARFFSGTRFEKSTKGNLGGSIKLRGTGSSLADVMGSSDGRIIMGIAGGTMSLLLIEAADLDLAEAIPLFLEKEKTTQIRCGVGDFNVRNGRLKSQIFVLDTVDSNVQGDVRVNLKNETLNARFDAKPKDGSILSLQSPIVVTGKLKKPQVGIDLAATGARGGIAGLLSAVLGPLAAIIPFIGTAEGEDSDCGTLMAHAKGAAS